MMRTRGLFIPMSSRVLRRIAAVRGNRFHPPLNAPVIFDDAFSVGVDKTGIPRSFVAMGATPAMQVNMGIVADDCAGFIQHRLLR